MGSAELEKQLDAEIRRSGDLAAALRLVLSELEGDRLSPLTQAQLAAYVKKELTRLDGPT